MAKIAKFAASDLPYITTEKSLVSQGLSEMQADFVMAFIGNGGQAKHAAETVGYSNPQADGLRLLGKPLVQAAIRAVARRDLVSRGAAIALKTLTDIAQDASEKATARVRAAETLLRWSGEIGQGAEPADRGDAAPEEMTAEQLKMLIGRLEKAAGDAAKVIDD